MWYLASRATISPALSFRSSSVSWSKVALLFTCSSSWNVAASWSLSWSAGWLQKKQMAVGVAMLVDWDDWDLVRLHSVRGSGLPLHVGRFATMAAAIPWPSSNLSREQVERSRPSSLKWIRCSASELYPLLLSALLDYKGHVNATAFSSWHIIQSFQSILVGWEVDGTWPSKSTSLKFFDMFLRATPLRWGGGRDLSTISKQSSSSLILIAIHHLKCGISTLAC